jgi:bzd-type benzoyl-CoA reductase Q subunit
MLITIKLIEEFNKMAQEYWKWPESRWTSSEIDWRKAKTITAGVDIGAVSSQAAVLCDGQLYCYANIRTLPESRESAFSVMQKSLEGTHMRVEDIRYIVATGYGRENVPFAHKIANEFACHAKGARFMYGPTVRTVVDLGGQAVKAIKLYPWDRVRDIMAQDKCATGMGRDVEIMADLMQVPVTEMGEKSLQVQKDPEPVSTTCYAFANTEAIGLFREGYTESQVLAAYLFAIACRIHTMAGRLNPEKELAFTGGLAKNPGIVKRLEKLLGMTALTSQYDPMLAGAIGGALLAMVSLDNASKTAVSV